jgi:uncharacterized membrane protein HdeD (DUF308 family)
MVVANHGDAREFSRGALHQHWQLFLIEGIVLILLGIGAVVVPAIASIAVAIFLGWLLLIGGVVGLVTTLGGRHAPGWIWSLLSAIVTIAAGAVMLGFPLVGAVSVTIVLAAYLVAEGLMSMLIALDHRRGLGSRWGWLFLNGAIDIVLAVMIVWLIPGAALWVLGIIVGIDFLFGGAALIGMALAARHPLR